MRCIKEMTPSFVAKMEDVLEIYQRPMNPKEPVVCLGRFQRLAARMTSKAGGVIDTIPGYFLERCGLWLGGGTEMSGRLDLWDGVHVFTEK